MNFVIGPVVGALQPVSDQSGSQRLVSKEKDKGGLNLFVWRLGVDHQLKVTTHPAHNVKTTLYGRLNDITTLKTTSIQRRSTSCAGWVSIKRTEKQRFEDLIFHFDR